MELFNFSLQALKNLKDMNLNIVVVFTKVESSYNSDFADLRPFFILNSIPVLHVENINHKNNIEPGKVISINNKSIIAKCFDNAIEIIEHEFKILPKIGI